MSEYNSTTTLPAVVEQFSIMTIDPTELREIIRENVGDQLSRLDLPTVRVPTAGGTSWTVPDVAGEATEKTLRGIAIYQTVARGYWAESFDNSGGGTPPSCYSNDGRTGVGRPGGECKKCPLNQWGSDPRGGNGKAFREMRLIFMLRENTVLPMVVVMPPTSIKQAREYFTGLAMRPLHYFGVMTEIGLSQERNKTGIKYSKATFKMVEEFKPEQVARLKAYREALLPTVAELREQGVEVSWDRWTPGEAETSS
jgi:hypothetical protein